MTGATGSAGGALRPATADPFLRMVKSLHDEVVQPLSAASVALSVAELSDDDRRRAAGAVATALERLEALLRAAAAELEPATTDDGGAGEQRLAAVVRSVVAEALANVRKHSGATDISIVVQGDAAAVTVDVLNDGVLAAAGRDGVGLQIAAVEARSVGGDLEYGPADDARWRVRLRLGA